MTKQQFGYLAAILGAIGAQVVGLPSWSAALTPAFIGGTIGVVAIVFKALAAEPKV